jgi:hypothetical protein
VGCNSKKEIANDELILDLRKKIDSLKTEIADRDEQIELLEDGIQLREGEISYWGHKYDSLKIRIEGERR